MQSGDHAATLLAGNAAGGKCREFGLCPARRMHLGWFMLETLFAKSDAVRSALQGPATRSLRRRRWIATLSAMALADAAVIALHQIGTIRRLPDLRGQLFQSNAVTTSKLAFPLGVPDAAIGTVFYALNLVAAAAGGTRGKGRSRFWSWVLAGNAIGGAVAASAFVADVGPTEAHLPLLSGVGFGDAGNGSPRSCRGLRSGPP
jgi:uncharacterized membrane protein